MAPKEIIKIVYFYIAYVLQKDISYTHTGKKQDLDFPVFTKPIWLIFELTIEYHLFQLQSSAIHLVLVVLSSTISVIS